MNKKIALLSILALAIPCMQYARHHHHHGHGGDVALGVGLGAIGVGLCANAIAACGESESNVRAKDNDGYKFWEVYNDTPYIIQIKSLGKRRGTIQPGETGRATHKKTWTLVVDVITADGRISERFTPHEHRYNHSLSIYTDKDGIVGLKSW